MTSQDRNLMKSLLHPYYKVVSIVIALGSTLGVAILNLSAREAKDPSLPRLTQFDWLAARHIGSDPGFSPAHRPMPN